MAISEYHLNYSHDEDRVYIFVRDGEGAEHAFGLTRRLFKKLWPALGKTVESMSETARKAAAPLKKEVLNIEQQGAVSEAKETGAFSNKPLPKVEKRTEYLTKIVKIRDGEAGGKVLILSDGTKVISIRLSYERLIVFCEALKSVAEKSDWDLKLAYPWDPPGTTPEAGSAGPPPADEPITRH